VDRWVHRQTYATLCFRVFSSQVMEGEQYAEEILPYLIQLAWDKVPNVRLVVARSLYNINMASYFCDNDEFINSDRFREAISYLAGDRDKDVRAFFNPVLTSSLSALHTSGSLISGSGGDSGLVDGNAADNPSITNSDLYDSDGEPIGDVSSLPV